MKAILANATNPAQHCKVLWQSTTFMRAQETATTWWLTGLPGAGKTTLAQALARALRQRGKPVCVIDGDELRAGLCQDLGFDDASRAENVRRAAHMARLLNDNAIHGVVAMVSPAVDARAAAYATVGLQRCKEIFVSTPLQVCEQRDPKGLYARARVNPLAQMSSEEVWAYIRMLELPYNSLHERGFISIGCEPCTRPVLPNQHEREGRWWWEEETQKECGLHAGNVIAKA